MKAVYLTEHGTIDVLTYGELPDPIAREGEAVVRVRACGLNHVDLWIRKGLPFLKVPFPFILGGEIAGELASVGPDTKAFPLGTKVLVNPVLSCGKCDQCLSGWNNFCTNFRLIGEHLPGGYAEFVKVPAANLVPLPAEMPFEIAACLPAAFLTAWNMIFEKAKLEPGEWILVHAGGSGVGSAAIQLAKLVGANIITTVGNDEKVEKAKALGAHHAINYNTRDFLHEVRRITKKRGVDVVIEHIGGEVWERSLLCLATGGRLVTCGATAGYLPKINLRHIFFRNLRVIGATGGNLLMLSRVIRLVQDGKLKPVLDRVLPLKDAKEAHRLLEARQQFGKLVLVPEMAEGRA